MRRPVALLVFWTGLLLSASQAFSGQIFNLSDLPPDPDQARLHLSTGKILANEKVVVEGVVKFPRSYKEGMVCSKSVKR
jgi:hypothetical protein